MDDERRAGGSTYLVTDSERAFAAGSYGKLGELIDSGRQLVTVDKALARDRELRTHATARPWHEERHGPGSRLVGPLPRATVVVDPYSPNPQDGPLLLHRINTYEALEEEIERLRAWLRDVRARLDVTSSRTKELPGDGDFEALARDLRAGINAALGERGGGVELASVARGRGRERG